MLYLCTIKLKQLLTLKLTIMERQEIRKRLSNLTKEELLDLCAMYTDMISYDNENKRVQGDNYKWGWYYRNCSLLDLAEFDLKKANITINHENYTIS